MATSDQMPGELQDHATPNPVDNKALQQQYKKYVDA
jgi:hypothetical protein